ncbi:hypothetical protein JVU11DRAFT_12594 [Chiua virens]|nr:hypothetical protein JVU11DRAFT_12594 [Chiua virens]
MYWQYYVLFFSHARRFAPSLLSFSTFRPVHGATKWIGGHGTTIAGVIVDSGVPWTSVQPHVRAGGVCLVKLRVELMCDIDPALNPFGAKFLLIQGVETLSLHAQRH